MGKVSKEDIYVRLYFYKKDSCTKQNLGNISLH